MGAWAGTLVDPAMFDYHDHMTHVEAGSPNPGYEVYPLKAMAEIDNTCRLAINFAAHRQGTGPVRNRCGAGGAKAEAYVCRAAARSRLDAICVPVTCP